jgi:hypothetical protein
MTRYPCASCGRRLCKGECYFETPEPTDEEGDTGITFADLLRLHGSQLGNPFGTEVRGDPLLPRKAA